MRVRIGSLAFGALALMTSIGPSLYAGDPHRILASGLTERGAPAAPSSALWLGADGLGRDELARALVGGTTSLGIALLATAVAAGIALVVGVGAGLARGRVERGAMFLADLWSSLPFLLVALVLHRLVREPSIATLAVLLGALSWTTLARVVRAKTKQVAASDFIDAARALGLDRVTIAMRHVLPHVVPTVLVGASVLAGQMVLAESAMSYLGVGVPPPHATWGSMLRDGQELFGFAPRLVIVPGVLITLTVLSLNLIGEGLRDALDPRDP